MEIEHKKINQAEPGDTVAVKLNNIARANDQVFKEIKNPVLKRDGAIHSLITPREENLS